MAENYLTNDYRGGNRIIPGGGPALGAMPGTIGGAPSGGPRIPCICGTI